MNRYLLILICLLFSLMMNAQEPKNVKPMDISNILSYDDFQKIKQFVLDKGQVQTYCNMYNDNPFYQFDDGIELYLNPIVQFYTGGEHPDLEAYNTMTIRIWDEKKDYPFMYTNIGEGKDTKKMFLNPYYDTEKTMEQRRLKIGKYIVAILDQINKRN